MSESDSKPTVYIFHGDDPLAMEREVQKLVRKMGDPATASFNITRRDGRTMTDEDLRTAVMTLPFLSERRLVIVTHPLARLGDKKNKAALERFTALLEAVPPSTGLVLVVEDEFDSKGGKLLPNDHSLMKWKNQAGRRVHYQQFRRPTLQSMAGWVQMKAKELGGEFTPDAAGALVGLVGSETQIALQEITKLLDYVNRECPVTAEDVSRIAAAIGLANIFEMTDALAGGNLQQAQRLLHALLEENDAQMIFGMIVRQFRLLIMAREALDDGISPARVGDAIGHKYYIEKTVQQAQRFTLARLEAIYHRLLEIDEAAKTSAMPLETALDLLVVEV